MMTATEYSGFDAMIDDMRKALGENTTCAQFMQRIRDRCLNSPLKSLGSRMRRVSDLISSGESAEQFYVPRVANWELYAISVVGSVGKRGGLAHDGFRAIAGVRRVTRRRGLVLVVLFQKQEIDT